MCTHMSDYVRICAQMWGIMRSCSWMWTHRTVHPYICGHPNAHAYTRTHHVHTRSPYPHVGVSVLPWSTLVCPGVAVATSESSGGHNGHQGRIYPSSVASSVSTCPACPFSSDPSRSVCRRPSGLRISHPDTDIPGQAGFALAFTIGKRGKIQEVI